MLIYSFTNSLAMQDDDSQDISDTDAFNQAMADVDRLKQDKTAPYRKKKPPRPLEHLLEQEEDDGFADTHVETPDFLDFMRPGIQHRVYQDLRRGVIEPEATLDLHGMRVVDARQALASFLNQSLRARRRCVRIIHGKGRGSASQQPVLKQKVNQWLPQREEVLAYCAAPRWDGGTGAAYVLLSRKWAEV